MNEKYDIQGMNCASCANHISEAVNKLEGIKSCDVSLLLNQMNIEKDDNLSSLDIINAVENAGYKASIHNPFKKEDNIVLKNKRIELIVCLICSILSMFLTMRVNEENNYLKLSNVLLCIILVILSVLVFYIQRQRLHSGLKQLINLKPTMDSLIALGSLASFIYSLINTCLNILNQMNGSSSLETNILFFDSSVMIISFSTIGKYLEEKAKIKTTSSITSLLNLMPAKVILYNNNIQKRVNIDEIKVNDLLLIKPGAKIPVDCIVIEGNSYIDNSILTGESLPIEVHPNSKIAAGGLNLNGILTVSATTNYQDSTFSKIIKLVDEAANSKAPISRLADKISQYFVFIVISISLITLVIWQIISTDFATAFNYAISVLVVSCPCALGLATPTAIMATSGKAASLGFIYKNGAILEKCSEVDSLVFDKTNTITKGYMQILNEINVSNQPIPYDILYTLENKNDHPIAKAFMRYLQDKNVNQVDGDVKYITSLGSILKTDDDTYLLGNIKLMNEYNVEIKSIYDDIYSTIYFAKNKQLLAVYYIGDELKDDIKQVINALNKYSITMLSGDNEKITQRIAQEVGIKHYYSQLLPQDKQKIIKENQQKGHIMAMIGDGINDSIALSTSDIGIAVNNATDIAINAADVIVNNDKMSSIVNILQLSKFAMKIIKENLLWALGYNCLLIPIAAGVFAFADISINPMLSSAAMSLSSISVVANALRINAYKPFKTVLSNDLSKTTYVLDIDHMMCEHCQKAVENALLDIGIISTTDLTNSTCIIEAQQEIDFTLVKQSIEKAGYKVTNITKK